MLLLLFDGTRSSFIFCTIQSISVILCLLFIAERPGLNLATSFYGFTLIALCLLPIAEYKMEIRYWGGAYLSDFAYINTSLLVLLSIVSFRFGYEVQIKQKNTNTISKLNSSIYRLQEKLTLKTIIFLITPCFYILASYNYDFIALQFRGMGEEIESVFIFELFFIKPLIFNIFFFYLLTIKYNSKNKWVKMTLFFFALLFFVNPLSVARFLSFCLFVPLLYLMREYRRKDSYLFINMVFFGLIFIFPILDIFRWFTLADNFDVSKNFNLDYYFAGHFDAFQNFARVVDLDIHTYGKQILGAIFFFIPRSIWVTKPVGSGFLLAKQAGLSFDNISMPLVSELYLDFSFIGVFIGILLLGFFYRRIDDKMAAINSMGSLSAIIKMIAYTEFCCLQFYLLRGNLLGAFAFSSSIMASVFVVYIYYFITNNLLKKSLYGIKS
jgi:oligosaccharide repeat unit polymerase